MKSWCRPLLALYVPRASSFISTKYFALNLDGWIGVLSKRFTIFDINFWYPLFYNYIYLISSITCYLFFDIFFLNFITNQIICCFGSFWNCLFLSSFKGTVMQIEKALINDRLRVSKVPWKFRIPTVYNFAIIYQ